MNETLHYCDNPLPHGSHLWGGSPGTIWTGGRPRIYRCYGVKEHLRLRDLAKIAEDLRREIHRVEADLDALSREQRRTETEHDEGDAG